PDHLLAVSIHRLLLCDQAGRIVAGALGFSRSARRRTHVLLGEPDGKRLHPLREVRSRGRAEEEEQVLLGRTHAEGRLRRDHQWADVEALPWNGGHHSRSWAMSASESRMKSSTGSSGIDRRRAEALKRRALASGRNVAIRPSACRYALNPSKTACP